MHDIACEALEVFEDFNPTLKWIETMKDGRKQRTIPQNSAAHLYFERLAVALNDAGYDVQRVMQSKLLTALQNFGSWLKSTGQVDAGSKLEEIVDRYAVKVEIPWNKSLVKDLIWKPIQKVMTGKASTTELNTVEPSEIYEVVNRFTAERFGVFCEWPSEESLGARIND